MLWFNYKLYGALLSHILEQELQVLMTYSSWMKIAVCNLFNHCLAEQNLAKRDEVKHLSFN